MNELRKKKKNKSRARHVNTANTHLIKEWYYSKQAERKEDKETEKERAAGQHIQQIETQH